jgi:hypothetical protein
MRLLLPMKNRDRNDRKLKTSMVGTKNLSQMKYKLPASIRLKPFKRFSEKPD